MEVPSSFVCRCSVCDNQYKKVVDVLSGDIVGAVFIECTGCFWKTGAKLIIEYKTYDGAKDAAIKEWNTFHKRMNGLKK